MSENGTLIATEASVIVDALQAVFSQFAVVAGQEREDKKTAQKATESKFSDKENKFIQCATLAFERNWYDASIEKAIDALEAGHNNGDDKREMATFASELRVAMHSRVRGVLPRIFEVGRDTWNAERAAVKKAAKDKTKRPAEPLMTAWPRCTHMLVAMLRQVKENDAWVFSDSATVIAYAVECDPLNDPEKTANAMKTMAKKLRTFFERYPHASLKTSADLLIAGAAEKGALLSKARKEAEVPPVPESNLRNANGEAKAPQPAASEPQPAAAESDAPAGDILADALAEHNAAA